MAREERWHFSNIPKLTYGSSWYDLFFTSFSIDVEIFVWRKKFQIKINAFLNATLIWSAAKNLWQIMRLFHLQIILIGFCAVHINEGFCGLSWLTFEQFKTADLIIALWPHRNSMWLKEIESALHSDFTWNPLWYEFHGIKPCTKSKLWMIEWSEIN